MKKLKGFTLVELLVVIAIIAVLATVVTISVSSNIAKAKNTSALQTLDSVQAVAVVCVNAGSNTIVSPVVAGNVCSTVTDAPGTWPDITANSSGWVYSTVAADNTSSGTSFKFTAIGGGAVATTTYASGATAIQCDETKCIKKGF